MTRQPGASACAAMRAAGEQSAAPAGNEQKVERPRFFEQFHGRRALARDDVGVIVRRNHGEAAFVRHATADRLAIAVVAIVDDHFAAVFFGGLALDHRRVGRHDDDARDVEHASRERDGLRVISR